MNQWLEEHYKLILAVIGIVIIGGIAVFLIRWQPAAPITIEPPEPTGTPGPVRVYISGAVNQSGVYTLPHGAIINDLLDAASGPANDASLTYLNLARLLQDGEHIYIPHEDEPQPTLKADEAPPVGSPGLININIASLEDLQTLPGIGPAIAARIIEYRNTNGAFASIEDLLNVSGIGPATLDDIRALVTVD